MRSDVVCYFDLFYMNKGVSVSDKSAYLKTEEDWAEKHGFGKYSSFGSFRVMKYRYIRFIQKRANEKRNKLFVKQS